MTEQRPTRLGAIIAIIRKDLSLYSRDLMFVFLTILSISVFVTLYWVLPRNVDETISMGISGGGMKTALTALAGDEGLEINWFDDAEEVRAAVLNRDIEAGLVFEDGFIQRIAAGDGTTVTIYVRPNLPEEITGAMESMVRELAYAVAGYRLPITQPDEQMVVVGEDRAGDQIPFRERMKPLYAFIVLMLEAVSLAALISSEVQERTVTAILSTPARVGDILLAKGAFGTGIAFTETMLILILVRAFGPAPLIVVVTVFLGAILVTSVAMIAGAAGRELMSTMLFGILMLMPLAVPAFAVLFPGEPATWVKFMPSYGIVRVVFDTAVKGTGWAEAARPLLVLVGWCVGLGIIGSLILKRRVETI